MPMTHDELQSAIWNDERHLPPGTREVALAAGWVLHREPERREKAHQAWTPPYYGVDADEWPVPGKTLIPKRPRLAVVAG